jgi:hypothetical protein
VNYGNNLTLLQAAPVAYPGNLPTLLALWFLDPAEPLPGQALWDQVSSVPLRAPLNDYARTFTPGLLRLDFYAWTFTPGLLRLDFYAWIFTPGFLRVDFANDFPQPITH